MKLSVVIVNYNVKHFLEQCLYSVQKAMKNVEGEVFVVDNNSVDGSCAMVKKKFPEVLLIENKKNTGFSYANNQAIKLSKGEYVLLLNPDTLVEENTFGKVTGFMDSTPDAGGLGVKMIDGKGDFLPESKRGLPTPMVAFYKIFGLAKLFPRSETFGKYHLGFLDKNKTHKVDVLSGAFMLLRKTALNKTGLLDETFFMYGEDIDLSYRITKAGYSNYYFPETTIIHYKGESTKKGSINYVLIFYNAMIIFARKHFSRKNANVFSFFIKSAVYFRAFLSILKRVFKTILQPLIDVVLIFLGFHLITPYWEHYKFPEGGNYPELFLFTIVPGYILVWLISLAFSGVYDKPVKLLKIMKGISIGTIIILIIYALLNEHYRFSRAMILMGAAWSVITLIIYRLLLNYTRIDDFKLDFGEKKRLVIIGKSDEVARIQKLILQAHIKFDILGIVAPGNNDSENDIIQTKSRLSYIGSITQLKEIARIHKIDEIIFCAKNMTSQLIIRSMLNLSEENINFKIATPESLSIIGSNSINTAGELYTITNNSIVRENNKRNKRSFDLISSIILLALSPLLVFYIKKPGTFLLNCLRVLFGKKSWVGYYLMDKSLAVNPNLPGIKPGIITPMDIYLRNQYTSEVTDRINMIYAKDYKVITDLSILLKALKHAGRKV